MSAPSLYEQVGDELVGAHEPSWKNMCESVFELSALDSTPQSPLHHAEGDVGIHTRMVLSELRSDPAWQAKSGAKRRELAWACMMHDIGKPGRTRVEEDGSITSRGHSGLGELMARQIMWDAGAGAPERESICRVAKWHQIPFFAGLKNDEQGIKRLSLSINLSELAICARADARGRLTQPVAARGQTLESIDLFELIATDLGVWSSPMSCSSPTERGLWLSKQGSIDPTYPWHGAQSRAVLVVACGLPGAGKSHLAALLGLPVVGLDWAREELGAQHGEQEGQARALALDGLKKLLAAGSSVFFDATNLVADHRERLAQIASDYMADCVFAHVEPPERKEWIRRNKARGARALPSKALEGMLRKWSAPTGEEGCSQLYWSPQAQALPVWGALSSDEWELIARRAAEAAREPRGKPKGPKQG
jgi:predicted kinase